MGGGEGGGEGKIGLASTADNTVLILKTRLL